MTEKEAECLFIAPEAHILLVDDNELNLVVAKELLKPLRMQIDTAENGLQAVKMVRGSQYDLVLMDHMMPVMDGIEAAKLFVHCRRTSIRSFRSLHSLRMQW